MYGESRIHNDASAHWILFNTTDSVDTIPSNIRDWLCTNYNATSTLATTISVGQWGYLQFKISAFDKLLIRVGWGKSGYGSWHTIF